jgi:hypothetical protein
MNDATTVESFRGRRGAAQFGTAAELQQQLLRLGFSAVLFVCGLCAWIFKLKGDGSSEGGLLPYSPLQVVIPLLGMAAVVWLPGAYGGQFPRLMVPRLSARVLQFGIAFIVVGAAVHLRTVPKDAALFIVRWLLPMAFITFVAVTKRYRVSMMPLVLGLAAGAVMSAVSVEAYRTFGVNLPVSAPMGGRYSGYLNHPNQYGILCSTTSPILLFLFHSRRRLLRVLSLLLVPVYLLCLYENLSKTNVALFFLALFVGSLALSLRNPRKLIGTVGVAVGIAVFLSATFGLAYDSLRSMSPKAAKVLEDALLNPAEAKSVNSREVIWETAMRNIRDHPLVGLGPGQAVNALGIDHAHNVLLQLYLDGGLAGFIGICLVIGAVFLRTADLLWSEFRSRDEIDDARTLRMLAGISLVTYSLANAMSDSFSTATMPAFLFFAAIAFSADHCEPTFGARRAPRRRRHARLQE